LNKGRGVRTYAQQKGRNITTFTTGLSFITLINGEKIILESNFLEKSYSMYNTKSNKDMGAKVDHGIF
jgi:hypothetical protein